MENSCRVTKRLTVNDGDLTGSEIGVPRYHSPIVTTHSRNEEDVEGNILIAFGLGARADLDAKGFRERLGRSQELNRIGRRDDVSARDADFRNPLPHRHEHYAAESGLRRTDRKVGSPAILSMRIIRQDARRWHNGSRLDEVDCPRLSSESSSLLGEGLRRPDEGERVKLNARDPAAHRSHTRISANGDMDTVLQPKARAHGERSISTHYSRVEEPCTVSRDDV